MSGQRLSPVLKPLYRLFGVSNFEGLVRAVLKVLFSIAYLLPMILIPLYFFFFTVLRG